MDEKTLTNYIPHFGDRVFAKNWRGSSTAQAASNAEEKKRLIDRIRSKMKLPSSDQATTSTEKHGGSIPGLGNKNALRKTRKFELGWMHFTDGYIRQVRRPTGGGTREIIVQKDDTVDKILIDGKKIFFPNGKSRKGHFEEFNFTLCLMGSDEPLDGKITVGELYNSTCHKVLRLYICSKKKTSDKPDLSESSLTDQSIEKSPTLPCASATDPSQTMSPHCSFSSLTTDEPLCSSSPIMHTSFTTSPTHIPGFAVEQSMSVSQDDEVIFLGQDGNILVDPFCDTLIYPPLQASNDEQASNINDPLNSITAAIYTNNEIIDLHINSQSQSEQVLNQEELSRSPTSASGFFDNPENIVEKQIVFIRNIHFRHD